MFRILINTVDGTYRHHINAENTDQALAHWMNEMNQSEFIKLYASESMKECRVVYLRKSAVISFSLHELL